jgi:hypothetical protein
LRALSIGNTLLSSYWIAADALIQERRNASKIAIQSTMRINRREKGDLDEGKMRMKCP